MGVNLKINKDIEKYIEEYSQSLHPIQKEIISYNESLGEIKKMQIAVSQCFFLELIIKISKFKNILEVGTFTGLSTVSMALGLPHDGKIIALDKNFKTNEIANNFFKKANQNNKIKTIVKPALTSLQELKDKNEIFDLVFIDADKENYRKYYDYGIQLIKKDGLIIIDNVLWYGEVADLKNNDKLTNIIREFNKYVKNDNKTKQVILPLGDGFMICRKL
tara:strand:+ start:1820 stop:2476 length:657 start_codon:yes stop_codon:yes gene_type:complete